MNLIRQFETLLGSNEDGDVQESIQMYINLKLAASGQPPCQDGRDHAFLVVAEDLLKSYREKSRLLSGYLCPPDRRIQDFIDNYLADTGLPIPQIPDNTLNLDRPEMARELSLPKNSDFFGNEYVSSYRIRNGVLHNPVNDRRTTKTCLQPGL